MKKEKFIENIMGSVLIILYSYFMLSMSLTGHLNLQAIISVFYLLYGGVHLAEYCFHRKEKEYSDLCLGILGCLMAGIIFFSEILETTKYLALTLLFFAMIYSLIKLKKADYHHDRKSKLWLIFITSLVLFFFSSLLLCLNLSYNDEIRTMIFGFYFQIIGIFEMYEALILNVTKGKLK